jgi:hypothetical protein
MLNGDYKNGTRSNENIGCYHLKGMFGSTFHVILTKLFYEMIEMMMVVRLLSNLKHAHEIMDLMTMYILQFKCQTLQNTKFYVVDFNYKGWLNLPCSFNKVTYKVMEMMMLAKLVLNLIHAHDLMDPTTMYILQFNSQALQSTNFLCHCCHAIRHFDIVICAMVEMTCLI